MKPTNLTIYRLYKPFGLSADDLNTKLKNDEFVACKPQEFKRQGWVPPHQMPDDLFVRELEGCLQITLKTEEKLLPTSVIEAEVSERVVALEEEQDRKVRKNERSELKEQVLNEMLPRAFSKYAQSVAYIDTVENLVVVYESSSKKAEDIASLLRKTIGSLPIRPIATQEAPQPIMTDLINLKRDFTNDMAAGFNTTLVDPLESTKTVTCKGVEPHSEEVRKHIEDGMVVKGMTLQWQNGNAAFEIDEKLVIKKLSLGEGILSELDEIDAEDQLALYDAFFTLFVRTVRSLVTDVTGLFGGEDLSAMEEGAEEDSDEE